MAWEKLEDHGFRKFQIGRLIVYALSMKKDSVKFKDWK